MTEESGPDEMLAKEQILAELMRQGITTPEEVLDETIPEVGGFMISSGGLSRGTWGTKSTFTGDWYIYTHEPE